MVSDKGTPPGPLRPKTTSTPDLSPPPPPFSPRSSPPDVTSPSPLRPTGPLSWASSLSAGLFPTPSSLFPLPPAAPHGLQPVSEAMQSAGSLSKPLIPLLPPLFNNALITDLAGTHPAPSPLDPWHRAHARNCAHATAACAACSISISCCSCRSLRFTPGPPPMSPLAPQERRSRSASPALFQHDGSRPISRPLFRSDVGNGPSPPPSPPHGDEYDDDAYCQALAEADTCDNSSCPGGSDAPARYTITVEVFDDGAEEFYDRSYRACAACNRACKKSFLGNRIKSRHFDNSVRDKAMAKQDKDTTQPSHSPCPPTPSRTTGDEPIATSIIERSNAPGPSTTHHPSLNVVTMLQDALHMLNTRPPTPAGFVATIRVKHDALCSHPVSSCPGCSLGLLCCECKRLFTPAVARHLSCLGCKHIASLCCVSAFCCRCSKIWSPSDGIAPTQAPARRFYGGAGSNSTSSPEPDIWTPSPRSSPDEIDDLTARANVPLPVSRPESDASRAPSRASSVDEPVNVAATPLPTPDYSALPSESIDGFLHPSFPERAILDDKDKRHFLGRGDLSVTSLKLYAR